MKYTRFFLSTVLMLAAAISGWAGQTTVEFGQVAQYEEKTDYDAGIMSDGSVRTLAIYSGGINTSTKLTAADDGYNSTAGASKFSCTGNKGSRLEDLDENSHKKSHVRFSALAGESVRLYYFSSSVLGKIHTFYLSHTTATYDAQVEGNASAEAGDKVLYYVDFTIPANGTYYISANGGKNTEMAGTQISVSGIRFTYDDPGTVIARAELTGETTYDASGLFINGTAATVKTKATNSRSEDITVTHEEHVGYRLNGAGNYVGISLNGMIFHSGDKVRVFVTKVPSQGSLAIYADKEGTELIYDTESYGVLGYNTITLPAAAEGKTSLFVVRNAVNTWNGNIWAMEASRETVTYEQKVVSEATEWDWNKFTSVTSELTESTTPAKNTNFLMADYYQAAEFDAEALVIAGQYAVSQKNIGSTSEKTMCFVGNYVMFETSVTGMVSAEWVANGATERYLTINGMATSVHSSATTDSYITTEEVFVEAGQVKIQCALADGTSQKQYFRLRKLTFTPGSAPAPVYETVRTAVAKDKIGTICLDKAVNEGEYRGASFYKLVGKDVASVELEEVSSLVAGVPYIFVADGGDIEVVYSGEAVAGAGAENGLVGTLTDMTASDLSIVGAQSRYYGISNNTLKALGTTSTIPAGRAYIDLDNVPEKGTVPVNPVARRFVISNTNTATAIEDVNAAVETVYYDLLGRRIDRPTQSGLYIVNGKKVFVQF